ncbi:unnamed protein product [Caenorhabditis bovis]|uniref:Rab-GAP TBC domain-containing protein n=1 Tax=Caenorhabditis bovis TaxID=2654633 RepID=A0A8S1EFR9_9PELO|nr:unnamed protein product [Caenorhabditis bovis]
MFRAGADLSDTSGDEDEVVPARVGEAAGRSIGPEIDEEGEGSHFRRAMLARVIKQNQENANGGIRRTTSSIARLSMAIRRSLRLPRRSEARMQKEREEREQRKLMLEDEDFDAPYFSKNTRQTHILPSSVPSRIEEIKENKRLNRPDKVKKILRKTDWPVTHEARGSLWKELCSNKDFNSSRLLYRDELAELERINQGKPITPCVLTEDGAVVNNFDLREQGTLKLVRLLTVIERLRPEIVYAPLIYPICALLLHFMDDDADCFACVNYLLSNKGYMMITPIQWAASSRTILSLVKKHKSFAYNMLKKRIGTSDDTVLVKCVSDWLSWIFQCLPLAYACRVVDCYVAEGHKFLIRSAISIIYIWSKIQKSIKNQDSETANMTIDDKVDAVKRELRDTATHIEFQISTSTFMATAVKIRNLQSSTISRLQTQYEDELRSESAQPRPIKKVRRTIFCEAFNSSIVDNESAIEIMSYMPPRLQLITPTLAFKLSQDGASFTHFWSKVDSCEQSILIIKTTKGEVFGAYLSSSWAERHDRKERSRSKYWGTGESYVFRMNFDLNLPEVFLWVGAVGDASSDKNLQYFMTATDRSLVIGSGGGDAIRISEELTHGMSTGCQTFNSPPLCKAEAFDIYELEVFDVPSSD